MQLILLAAGQGTRLPKKFKTSPKCLVKINNKTILEHNNNFYNKFKYKTIVSGYKNQKLDTFIKRNKFQKIINEKYKITNMVYSLFEVKALKSKEIVICYADIIFDPNIFEMLKKEKYKSTIILKKNWLEVWKGRMNFKNIFNDAEDVIIKKNKLISIGQKIKNKLPQYQFMGIIKLKLIDFKKLKQFFIKLKNPKVDFTTFLDLSLKNKVINLNVIKTKKFWYEVDSYADINYTSKNIW